jgi:SAM-dependent methyltransferase
MRVYRFRNKLEFDKHMSRISDWQKTNALFLQGLEADGNQFFYEGFSYPAGREVAFSIDFMYSSTDANGSKHVNWRERVVCPITGLNNRMRCCIQLLDMELSVYDDSKIYITEQLTPVFAFLQKKYPKLQGSEFLGNSVELGKSNSKGIRNEDITQLTFDNQSLDHVLSFDVLEHVADYQRAFTEIYRVLAQGGHFFWSVPFAANSLHNITRAYMEGDKVVHLLPPEYHGDPLSDQGVLCFRHFGWEMLEEVKNCGFRDAHAISCHSNELGYLGEPQLYFIAVK